MPPTAARPSSPPVANQSRPGRSRPGLWRPSLVLRGRPQRRRSRRRRQDRPSPPRRRRTRRPMSSPVLRARVPRTWRSRCRSSRSRPLRQCRATFLRTWPTQCGGRSGRSKRHPGRPRRPMRCRSGRRPQHRWRPATSRSRACRATTPRRLVCCDRRSCRRPRPPRAGTGRRLLRRSSTTAPRWPRPRPTAATDIIDAPGAAAPGGFAPPTMDMRAEVIYARLAEEHAKATGKPSVVFVDDATPETPQSRRERAGALRRLISSIRSGR